jgi:hypothetical protein
VDRWLFLFGVIAVCCLLYPPFLGLWIAVACFYGVAFVIYTVLGGLMR